MARCAEAFASSPEGGRTSGWGWQTASEAGGQMINGSKVTIRLAAVQNRSLRGQVEANLEHAAGLVEQAAAQGR